MDLNSNRENTYTVRPVIIGTSNNGALGFDEEAPGEEESEEVILGKRWKRGLQKPSAEEVRRHMISHYPYRSWCEYCMRGKAKDSPRKQVFREEWESEPVYTWDYMYMKTKAATGSSDAEMQNTTDSGNRPIIIGKDRRATWVTAHVAKRKGDDPCTIKRIGQEFGNSGYARLTLKSDQESCLEGVLEKYYLYVMSCEYMGM